MLEHGGAANNTSEYQGRDTRDATGRKEGMVEKEKSESGPQSGTISYIEREIGRLTHA